ncbi:MAG: TonB-dependent receptor [Bacteroidetes bacterium]|nr:MAG: TonB-dependent receptor [Bacteroidota bacterium]
MKGIFHLLAWLAGSLLLWGAGLPAQTGTVQGKLIDPLNQPIPEVTITVPETSQTFRSDGEGSFRFELPAGRTYLIQFTHAAYQRAVWEVEVIEARTFTKQIKMLNREMGQVDIVGERDPTDIGEDAMLVSPISMEQLVEMPTISPSVEGLMKGMPGVSTNNEFSSQYQVRGGNFDENLVYVNGIEIYRPFLARAGQQEGLGFSNPSLAQDLRFSTGGFAARYGDKLSSVLDITYREPREFRATAELGIITTNLHVEGRSQNRRDSTKPGRFTYLMGARRFAMSYFLNSLETRGDYRPSFLDYQGMFTFTPKSQYYPEQVRQRRDGSLDTLYYANEKLKFTTFVALTRNRYQFEPRSKVSTFGTISQAFRVQTAFEGREVSNYNTGLGAFMIEHRPHARLKFDYIFTAFRTQEAELFDVEGGYLLGEVNTNFASEEFNESEFDLGIGTEFRHARNYLTATVASAQAKGSWTLSNDRTHRLHFGLKYQYQLIDDNLEEYSLLDSAGYVVDESGHFNVDEYIRGQVRLPSNQYKGYLQHDWRLSPRLRLESGARLVYYDLIDRWMFSPRVQLLMDLRQDPQGEPLTRLRVATGMYQQAPFYREFRRFDGSLNTDLAPQQAIHGILGLDHQFYAWNRPFRLFAEAYYKYLDNIIPYEVQNVRIRYYPDEVATGYATGVDLRINGEFIKGVDSWVSLGVLKTAEDIVGDDRGFVPRPTDQRFTFAMYFQDELPIDPTFKVHISYIYGSGLRHGPPQTFDQRTAFGFPAYHRADLGFSKLITFQDRVEQRFRYGVESIWATIEIFNLFQRSNTVSYVWIKDLQNNRFAVNNYLSARLLNVRVVFKLR